MRTITILSLAVLITGCAARAQQPTPMQSTHDVQIAKGIIPCDTDTDCLEKNGEGSEGQETTAPVILCEAITKSNKRCSRRVPEAGLLCKQHSKMQKEGKTVKTID